jgi:hypothetical protein
MAEKWHSGISMHKLPVDSGFIGVVFAVGTAFIFLLGLPQLWYFVALSAVLGLVLAIGIRYMNSRRTERTRPLSILQVPDKARSERDGQTPVNQLQSMTPANACFAKS